MSGTAQTAQSRQAAVPSDGADALADGPVTAAEQVAFHRRLWRQAPRPVRRGIVTVVGSTLLLLGLALVVLPGPFTVPLVIAGTAVLASEFAWAERLLRTGKTRTAAASAWVRGLLSRR